MSKWEGTKSAVEKEPSQVTLSLSHTNSLCITLSPSNPHTAQSLSPAPPHTLTLSSHYLSTSHSPPHTLTVSTVTLTPYHTHGFSLPPGKDRVWSIVLEHGHSPSALFCSIQSTYPPLCEGWVRKRFMYIYTQVYTHLPTSPSGHSG